MLRSAIQSYDGNAALQELLAVTGISDTITPFNDASDEVDLSLHEVDGQTAPALQFSGQELEDNPERRVLVLGLNNSGKSTLLNQVTTGSTDVKTVKPTEGFRVTSLQNKDVSLNIWEIGGGPNVRQYWSNFLQDTDLLVFVVDAADDHNLPLAFRELKNLLGDERLAHVPLLILANKQDLPNAKKCEEIADILDLNSIPSSKHKVRVLGTTAIPSAEIARHPSILEVQQALFSMTNA